MVIQIPPGYDLKDPQPEAHYQPYVALWWEAHEARMAAVRAKMAANGIAPRRVIKLPNGEFEFADKIGGAGDLVATSQDQSFRPQGASGTERGRMTLEDRAMQVLREAYHGRPFRCSAPALAEALGVSHAETRAALGRLMDKREISIWSRNGHPFVRLHNPPAEVRHTRLGGSFRPKPAKP
ncbi:MAG TPA: hypothetical protein VFE60_11615 [Roseiarcus sp.]|jgi:hypothetical protein|nr:hypothetical protein [Roseiarcus sp.]